jgi:hypothetical protein
MGLYTTTEQASTPATPASGFSALYPKSDGLWYWKDDAGVEHAIIGDGAEITGATLNNCVGKGTWTASGTWTLPALTLGGNVASTGNPSLNIGSGALTAGATGVTTLTASGSVTAGDGAADKLTVIGGGASASTIELKGGNSNDNAAISSVYSMAFQVDNTNAIGGREFSWRKGGYGYSDGTRWMLLDSTGLAITGALSATGDITLASGGTNGKLALGNQSGSYFGFIFQDAGTTGKIRYNSYAALGSSHGHQFESNGTAVVTIDYAGNVLSTGYFAGAEQTAPSAPAANGYRIFAQDNGAGKTQLMVLFASGAAQQIAIEP